MKVIVLTGGGTSGHVTPNLALIPELKNMGFTIHYIGSKNGIEKQLIEKEAIPYHTINTGKFRRYFDMKNFSDIFRVFDGFRQAFSVLGKLKADILFSKGGFVSCPVVWAAWMRKIPVVIHESDITPGLTNKLSMPFAKKVCFTFPESEQHISEDKGVLTGMPIRKSLLSGNMNEGRRICGFTQKKPVIVIIGGSLGSEKINFIARKTLDVLLKDFNICHICGKGNIKREYEGINGYRQFEYIDEEQPHIFAMADLFISRAGATILFEILALKKPNLLIPLSRAASRGDQILNAQSFANQGLSLVLPEEKLNEELLVSSVLEVYRNRNKYTEVMKLSNAGDGVNTILKVIEKNKKENL
jgi:UDP-N-acetylglucosamine--N-acetylmuramyl-(pentapeptide) pyrophosphoryl-undecaprenol N-acetylglucosamine transferase